MIPFIRTLLLGLCTTGLLLAQGDKPVSYRSMGVDMELLSYGGSLGAYVSYHPNEALSLEIESDWSLVEANDTYTYYNYYGQPVSINNRNLSFVKLMPGLTWYPFIETMHPSFQIAGFLSAGPVWALNTADDEALLDRWQDVEVDLAPLVRAGVHLRILSGQGSAYTFRVGYDYLRFDRVIDARQTYRGLFLQAGMEFVNR